MEPDSAVPFIHRLALCETDKVGAGTRVWAFAHIMAGAVVGRDCNICGHAFIESGALIGDRVTVKNGVLIWDRVFVEDDVFLGPGVIFTNDLNPRAQIKKSSDDFVPTHIRKGASLGAGAVVVCGVEVGENAFVGAGSVVTRDVPSHRLVVGNPARPIGWVCDCGRTLDSNLECSCGRAFEEVRDSDGTSRLLPRQHPGRMTPEQQ